MKLTDRQIRNFHKKVAPPDENGCMLWTASVATAGYGQTHIKGMPHAHRVAYYFSTGEWPPRHVQIRHVVCGEKLCCNARHMAPGSAYDNMQDWIRHGRKRSQPLKLTSEQVEELRWAYRNGTATVDLAVAYKVSKVYVQMIARGEARKSDPGPLTFRKSGNAKLTPQAAFNIRIDYAAGNSTMKNVGVRYQVSPSTVWQVVHGNFHPNAGGPIKK